MKYIIFSFNIILQLVGKGPLWHFCKHNLNKSKLILLLTQRTVDSQIADVWHYRENRWNSCQLRSMCCCRTAMAARGWTSKAGSTGPTSWAHCSRCRARKKLLPSPVPHLRTERRGQSEKLDDATTSCQLPVNVLQVFHCWTDTYWKSKKKEKCILCTTV